MTEFAGTIASDVSNEIPPFEVNDLRSAMAEAELEDIIDELVEAFLEDAPSRMEAIGAAVYSANTDEIRATAHAYKSAAASMGAKQLADLLRQLEVAGAQGEGPRAAALLPQVKTSHDIVVTRLKDEFQT